MKGVLRGSCVVVLVALCLMSFGPGCGGGGGGNPTPTPSDRDKDGVLDRDDQCPDTPGPASNNGCPIPTLEGFRASSLLSPSQIWTATSVLNSKGLHAPESGWAKDLQGTWTGTATVIVKDQYADRIEDLTFDGTVLGEVHCTGDNAGSLATICWATETDDGSGLFVTEAHVINVDITGEDAVSWTYGLEVVGVYRADGLSQSDMNRTGEWDTDGGTGSRSGYDPERVVKTVAAPARSGIVTSEGRFATCGLAKNIDDVGCLGYVVLGDITSAKQTTFRWVLGLDNVIEAAMGDYATIILTSERRLFRLKDDDRIEIAFSTSAKPTAIQAVNGVGTALMDDGTVWTWSARNDGTPSQFVGLEKITQLAQGSFMLLAVDASGDAYFCDLATGDIELVEGIEETSEVAAVGSYYYFLSTAGVPRFWTGGFVGDHDSPQVAYSLSDVVHLWAGSGIFAQRSDAAIWAWGGNAFGGLGLGHTEPPASPTKLSMEAMATLGAGRMHTLWVDLYGHLLAAGRGGSGQLGLGTTVDRYTFTEVDLSGLGL